LLSKSNIPFVLQGGYQLEKWVKRGCIKELYKLYLEIS
jgi:hypothetical protein